MATSSSQENLFNFPESTLTSDILSQKFHYQLLFPTRLKKKKTSSFIQKLFYVWPRPRVSRTARFIARVVLARVLWMKRAFLSRVYKHTPIYKRGGNIYIYMCVRACVCVYVYYSVERKTVEFIPITCRSSSSLRCDVTTRDFLTHVNFIMLAWYIFHLHMGCFSY